MGGLPDPHPRPCVTAEEAFRQPGHQRNTGYRAIRAGTFPLPVIRVGRVIRVPTVALRHLLLIDGQAPERHEGAPQYAEDPDVEATPDSVASAPPRSIPAPHPEGVAQEPT